jgi:hypothetical protein
MKNVLIAVTLFAVSAPCFSEGCFDSPEYKNSVVIAKAANSERAAQLGKAVNFLTTTKGLNFDQALGEVMRFSSPETVAYDKALSEVGEKIRPMKPQSPEECSELIKLQRQYEAIGKDKIQFVVSKIIERAGGTNPEVNTGAAR